MFLQPPNRLATTFVLISLFTLGSCGSTDNQEPTPLPDNPTNNNPNNNNPNSGNPNDEDPQENPEDEIPTDDNPDDGNPNDELTCIPDEVIKNRTASDNDGDGIINTVDAFPDSPCDLSDTDLDTISDRLDTDDNSIIQPSIEIRNEVRQLWQTWVNFHIGFGEFVIDNHEEYYDAFERSHDDLQKQITQYDQSYDDLNLSNEPSLGTQSDIKFETAVDHLYFLGLGYQYYGSDNDYDEKALELFDWLMEQLDSRGTSDIMSEVFHSSKLGNGLILIRDLLEENNRLEIALNFLWKDDDFFSKGTVPEVLFFKHGPELRSENIIYSADYLRAMVSTLVAAVLLLPDTSDNQLAVKISHLTHLKNFLISYGSVAPSIEPFVKPDFSAYHHYTNYTSGYVPQAMSALSRIIYLISNTRWALTDDELYYIRGYAKNVFYWSHLDHIPSGLIGRLFSQEMVDISSIPMLPLISQSLSHSDDELLQVAKNVIEPGDYRNYRPVYRLDQSGFPGEYRAFEDTLNKLQVANIESDIRQGVRIYPYSTMLAARQSNWASYVQGFDRWTWTYEGGRSATNPQNIYGVYNRYGAMQLYYIDPTDPAGGATLNPLKRNEGFDWSHYPGITAPYRTLDEIYQDNILSRKRLLTTKPGGVSITDPDAGSHGLFIVDLRNLPESLRDVHFSALKTYFYFGDRIILLGSNISNQTTDIIYTDKRGQRSQYRRNYPIHTTLFQNYLNQSDPALSPIRINNNEIVATSYDWVGNNQSAVIEDADGTGYYIAADSGPELIVKRHQIISRQQDDSNGLDGRDNKTDTFAWRASAYLNHGINPSNKSYEYVVIPNGGTTKALELQELQKTNSAYQVLQQDSDAHIVRDKQNQLWGYALFDEMQLNGKGPITHAQIYDAGPSAITPQGSFVIIADDSQADELRLAATYTDLRLYEKYLDKLGTDSDTCCEYSKEITLELTVSGLWQLDSPIEGVQLSQSSGSTVVRLASKDGASTEILLNAIN